MALKTVSAMSTSMTRVAPCPREPKMGLTTTSPPSSLKAFKASFTLSVAKVRGTGTPTSSRNAQDVVFVDAVFDGFGRVNHVEALAFKLVEHVHAENQFL